MDNEKENPNIKESDLSAEELSGNLERLANVKNEKPKEHIRTFASDISKQVQGKNMSVIQIALAEQKRRDENVQIVKKSKQQKILYLVLAGIAFIGGVGLIAFALNYKDSTVPIPSANQPKANAIVFSENQKVINSTNLSRVEFLNSIDSELPYLADVGITNIIPVTYDTNPPRALSGEEFLQKVARNSPEGFPELVRDDFMLGYLGQTKDVFLILKFEDFDSVLSLMREWEDFLVQDMVSLMNIPPINNASIFAKDFDSEIILNKSSRVLRNDDQSTILMYTFMDRKHLVLASKQETIQEVLNRYTIQEIQ